jgi:hypothetical protein
MMLLIRMYCNTYNYLSAYKLQPKHLEDTTPSKFTHTPLTDVLYKGTAVEWFDTHQGSLLLDYKCYNGAYGAGSNESGSVLTAIYGVIATLVSAT